MDGPTVAAVLRPRAGVSTVPTSGHAFWQHGGVAYLEQAFLLEDDVVQAVMQHLESDGWSIESFALAHQHGDDIVATRAGQRLIVEAKGAGSSKSGTKRFGQPFTRNQVGSHVSVAIHRSLKVWSSGVATAAMAFPDNAHHRALVAPVQPALTQLGILVFWVGPGGSVSTSSGGSET